MVIIFGSLVTDLTVYIFFFSLDLLPSKDDKDLTKCFLLQVVNILLHYIEKTFDVKSKILDFHHPHQLLEGFDGFNLQLSDHAESLEQLLVDCTDTLKYGVKTGDFQICAPKLETEMNSLESIIVLKNIPTVFIFI